VHISIGVAWVSTGVIGVKLGVGSSTSTGVPVLHAEMVRIKNMYRIIGRPRLILMLSALLFP
jgi:hypothetical protein